MEVQNPPPGRRPLRLLYCHCAYAHVVPKETKEAVLRGLTASGVAFDAVADLCEMSARKDPALGRLAEAAGAARAGGAGGEAAGGGEGARIAACYPRAVRWLFNAAGTPLPEAGCEVLNMRTRSADEVLAALLSSGPPAAEPPAVQSPAVQSPAVEVAAAGRGEEQSL